MSALQDIVAANRAGERAASARSARPTRWSWKPHRPAARGRRPVADRGDLQPGQPGGRLHRDAGRPNSGRSSPAWRARGLPAARLILGGDHLGPNPWRHEPAEAAMAKAETLVRSYAEAGFAKIHLDASMACAGDPDPLPAGADRAARHSAGPRLPRPRASGPRLRRRHRSAGAGRRARDDRPSRGHPHRGCRPDDRGARSAFAAAGSTGLAARARRRGAARRRVRQRAGGGLRARAAAARGPIRRCRGLAFEAHSTDYQTEAALAAPVARHFAILKVAPA